MSPLHIRPIARRRFVQGLAIGGSVAGFAPALLARSAPVSPAELSGTEFDLEIADLPWWWAAFAVAAVLLVRALRSRAR